MPSFTGEKIKTAASNIWNMDSYMRLYSSSLISRIRSFFSQTPGCLESAQYECKWTGQEKGKSQLLPVRFYNLLKKIYTVSHLEILAVVWALQHFREIVIVYKVTVYTDHAPIRDFQRQKNIWSTRSMVPNNTNVQFWGLIHAREIECRSWRTAKKYSGRVSPWNRRHNTLNNRLLHQNLPLMIYGPRRENPTCVSEWFPS